ncbi:MAG: response regulator [Verrucomicrobiota bacterium]|nr:response regulator [Limisphaera sp.]MDW8381627.1 response regulator [Verrucomicrobiota bacterium]
MNPSLKILLVDDESNVLAALQRNLRGRFHLETATSGPEALAKIEQHGPYAVVVADMQMPEMTGLDLLVQVESRHPDTVRIMLTGNAEQKTAVDAVNRGHVFRFLNKPCPSELLAQTLQAALHHYQFVTAERELLERTLNGTIRLLTEILASLHPKAFQLSQKLRAAVREYAEFFHLKQSWDLEAAALLFPLGYMTLPATVLTKLTRNEPLLPKEQELADRAPELGANLLLHIPRMESVATILRYQNKRYDGSGSPPERIAGDDLPMQVRVFQVLRDMVELELQTGDRTQALARMQERTGWYDPRVLQSAAACFDVYLQKAVSDQPSIRSRTLDELTVGQILASDVETEDGILVIKSGTELTPVVLQRLRNFAQINPVKQPIYVLA